ncbi:MAG: beta strand repeat-containing protein, partial [Pirellula sp.]
GINPTGNVLTNDTDQDAGDTKTVSGVAAGVVASASTNVSSNVIGSYGTINIAANGAYTYTVDNSNATVQALRTTAGTLQDVFTYTMRDTSGLTSTTQITITIQGANDAPTDISGTLTIAENSANGSTVGTVNTTDVDSGDSFTYTLTNNAGGRFSINATSGQVTVANGTLLDFESSSTHTIVVQSTDAAGASFTKTMTVAVTNANDRPIAVADTATAVEAGGVANATAGTNPTGNVLTNDTDVDGGDTKTVSGVAAGTVALASTNVGSSVTGTYGSITISSAGAYTYTVDNSNAAVQALRTSANTLADVFTYTMRDTAGVSSTTQITVTIQGANDAPSDLATTGLTVAENSANGTTVGTLTRTDIDSGDTATYSLVDSAGGRFAINSTTGVVTVADGTLLNFEAAASHNITVRVTDTAGATYDEVFAVSLTNVNDAPAAIADTATAVEAGGVANGTAGTNPTGNVLTNDTDADAGDTKTVSGVAAGTVGSASTNVGSSVTGTYGSITINSAGAYTYTVDNSNAAVSALRLSSNTLSDVFTYTMRDTAGLTSTTQITVTIQGANDAPTAANDSLIAIEAGGVSNGTAGSNPTGNLLTNDTDLDSTGNGETKTVTGIAVGSVANPTGTVGVAMTGTYGSMSIASTGAYTYTVDNSNGAVQALRLSSQTLSETFTYRMSDAGGLTSIATVTVTIQGANDNPVAVVDAGTATEAGGYANATVGSNATGNVLTNDTDADTSANGETKTITGVAAGTVGSAVGSVGTSVTGSYGTITIGSTGAYTYVVNESNATVQALRLSSQAITDVFTYTVTDTGGLTGTNQITVTIQGANDAPTGVDDSVTAVESGGVSNGTSGTNPTGNVLTNDSDPDSAGNGETKTVTAVSAGSVANPVGAVASSITGTYGSINIAANGAYTFTVDNTNASVQALRLSSQTLSETFTYRMSDASGLTSLATVTVTIQGDNDNPVGVLDTGTATEAGGYANATVGSNATGNVLTNDTDVDTVGNGETKAVTGVASGTVGSAVGSVGTSVTGTYGSITIGASGAFTYVVNESNTTVQALRLSSQTIIDVFTYTVSDASGATATTQLSITIQGANDAPVSVDDTTIAVEAGGLSNGTAGTNPTGNVLTNDTDVDSSGNGETKTVTGVASGSQVSAAGWVGVGVTGSYGSINIGATGVYTYTVDNSNTAVQALRITGQTLSDVFTYTMADTAGLTSTSKITVTITGANDTPVAVNDSNTAVEAGGVSNGTAGTNPTGNVLTNDTDVDTVANGETKTVTGV